MTMGDEINNLILLFIGTVFHFFINDPFWPIFKREPPLLQQVGFELFEVIQISNFTGQGENNIQE